VPIHEVSATINAGDIHTWAVGDEGGQNGFFDHGHRLFFDAHQVLEDFATGYGNEVELSGQTSEFMVGNKKYRYYIRVRISRAGLTPILYHLRFSW
jgi:hypothetical protein